MRKLLIITSMYTGHGHKSIAEALAERLSAYDDIEIKIIDREASLLHSFSGSRDRTKSHYLRINTC